MTKQHRILLAILLGISVASPAETNSSERGRMENILNAVSKEVQKNFYDPKLKGLDWLSLTEQARQRIRNADHVGEMIGAISGLLYQLHDSHTVFIPPGRTVHAVYGFKAQPFAEDVLVYDVQKNGPAAKAGLKVGDHIIGIDNINVTRSTYFDIMHYLSVLDPRTELYVEVAEQGSSQTIKIPTKLEPHPRGLYFDYNEIMREIDAQERFYSYTDYEGGIVYLKLRSFGVSAGEMGDAAGKAKNAQSVIIDLRGNGGGTVESMKELLGRLTDEAYDAGQSVSRQKSDPLHIKPVAPQVSGRLFVLIDSASASASEIVARTMQLRKRALVIGDRSSGRVNAARLFWDEVGAYDKVAFGTEVAVSRVVMQNGEELENQGVTPDELCIPSSADLRSGKDPCLARALALARTALESRK